MTTHTVSITQPRVQPDSLGFFRYGRLSGGYILTSESGEWHYLGADEFNLFLSGKMPEDHEAYSPLSTKGFIREGLELDLLADKVRSKKRFLGSGPTRHSIQLSTDSAELSVETAKLIVDHLMLSTAAELRIEAQLGPKPMNMEVLHFLREYAIEKNRYEGKKLTMAITGEAATLSDENVDWLAASGFDLAVHLDGPADLHDANRGAGTHATVTGQIARFHAALTGKRRDLSLHGATAIVTVTDASADRGADVVVALTEAGIARFTLVNATSAPIYAGFYGQMLDAIVAAGGSPVEQTTAALAQRILRGLEVSHSHGRSPSAAGLCEAAYDCTGNIFPCDAARELNDQGNSMFLLGTVGLTSYRDHVGHPTVRALTMASLLECLPGYRHRWTTPYAGIDPVKTFAATGDLFPQFPTSAQSATTDAMIEAFFERLTAEGSEVIEVFDAWCVD